MKTNLCTILALAAITSLGHAQTTYTWTGAVDGDWANADNWDGSGVPVDDNVANEQLTLNAADSIVFNGATMPTEGVPSINSGTYVEGSTGDQSTPTLVLNSGGVLSFPSVGDIWTNIEDGSIDRTVFTIGDGVGPAGEVTLDSPGTGCFMRHGNGTHRFQVNSDGAFISNGAANRWAWNGTSRLAYFTIDGGTVDINGTLGNATQFHAGAVTFTSIGGSFSADFGNAFFDIAAVEDEIGPGKDFQSSDFETIGLAAVDNLDGSFTVSAVEPPDSNDWTGNGSSVLGDESNNFTFNGPDQALDEGTFADLVGASDKATFRDEYFFNGGSAGVTVVDLTTVAGGAEIKDLEFLNNAVNYSVNSPDGSGIAGETGINLFGTGELTLTGDHLTFGSTGIGDGATLNLGDGTTDGYLAVSPIGIGGTLGINAIGAYDQDGTLISGTGALNKRGAGVMTVVGASGFSGQLNIVEGNVILLDNFNASGIDIAAGSILEYDAGALINNTTVTYTGGGILRKTNTGEIRWGNSVGTFALGSGSLIDLDGGELKAANNSAQEVWTNNLSGLNVGIDGFFNGKEANVRVDALSGEGLITTGSDYFAYVDGFTFGVDNGSGTFLGELGGTSDGFYVKEGTGTQILDGPISINGDIIIEGGGLTLGSSSVKTFFPEGAGEVNGINGTGTGVVNMNGQIFIDFVNVAQGAGNVWTLVDHENLTSVSYDQNLFLIDSSLGFFDFPVDGVWTLNAGTAEWRFDEANGQLSYHIGEDARLWVGKDENNPGLWDQNTSLNFMENATSDPLVPATFDTALLLNDSVSFSDDYFDAGSGIPVGSSDLTIAAGGVQGGTVNFLNVGTAYTITSSDANGITGATNINVSGGGSVVFRGDHASTGITTLSSILTFDTETAASFTSSITGNGGLEKTGAGVQTLLGLTDFGGATTVTGGELILTTTHHSSATTIASGGTLTYDFDGSFRIPVVGTYSGAGTLKKTGTGSSDFSDATFAFEAGAVVDVQEGTLKGGSSKNEDWSANLSNLNIGAGGIFTTVEANVFVDAVTGDGILGTGFGGAGYQQLTIGVNNGSGTFSGDLVDHAVIDGGGDPHFGALSKVGTGTQTLAGSCSIRGDITVVDGALTVEDIGSITFYPAGNGVSNQILGVNAGEGVGNGVVNMNGAVFFDFSDTDSTPGNTWSVINEAFLTVNVGATFRVASTVGLFSDMGAGLWQLDAGGNLWSFDVPTATLSVEPGTEVGYSVFQTTYFTQEQINSGAADEDVDFDTGGLENGIEFVVGGDPTDSSDDAALAPTLEEADGGYIFRFRRTIDSASDEPGVEYGSDLSGFILALDGVDGVEITVDTSFYEPGIDRVNVFLPETLAFDGKLFARLAVTPGL